MQTMGKKWIYELFPDLNAIVLVPGAKNEYTMVFDCDPVIFWELDGIGKWQTRHISLRKVRH